VGKRIREYMNDVAATDVQMGSERGRIATDPTGRAAAGDGMDLDPTAVDLDPVADAQGEARGCCAWHWSLHLSLAMSSRLNAVASTAVTHLNVALVRYIQSPFLKGLNHALASTPSPFSWTIWTHPPPLGLAAAAASWGPYRLAGAGPIAGGAEVDAKWVHAPASPTRLANWSRWLSVITLATSSHPGSLKSLDNASMASLPPLPQPREREETPERDPALGDPELAALLPPPMLFRCVLLPSPSGFTVEMEREAVRRLVGRISRGLTGGASVEGERKGGGRRLDSPTLSRKRRAEVGD
jgi:hypothetical protein